MVGISYGLSSLPMKMWGHISVLLDKSYLKRRWFWPGLLATVSHGLLICVTEVEEEESCTFSIKLNHSVTFSTLICAEATERVCSISVCRGDHITDGHYHSHVNGSWAAGHISWRYTERFHMSEPKRPKEQKRGEKEEPNLSNKKLEGKSWYSTVGSEFCNLLWSLWDRWKSSLSFCWQTLRNKNLIKKTVKLWSFINIIKIKLLSIWI